MVLNLIQPQWSQNEVIVILIQVIKDFENDIRLLSSSVRLTL